MKEIIEVETGFSSGEAGHIIRISAEDVVVLAKAMKGRSFIDVWVTGLPPYFCDDKWHTHTPVEAEGLRERRSDSSGAEE